MILNKSRLIIIQLVVFVVQLLLLFLQKNHYNSIMQPSESQKYFSTTAKKDKIFNVRRLPYKQFDNEKFLKSNYSPLLKKDIMNDVSSRDEHITNMNKKNMDYHYQLAIMASPAYRQLQNKWRAQKGNHQQEKEMRLKILKQKEEELQKYVNERRRLQLQTEKLIQKRDQLRTAIYNLRQRREAIQLEQNERKEEERLMNLAYLRNMMMGMYYQGGQEIDPDNMTYQELLHLQQKIGKVSKGIKQQQYEKIQKIVACSKHEGEVCSICYQNINQQQLIHELPCKHFFHCDCIKEWLLTQKICPLCKQQLPIQQTS